MNCEHNVCNNCGSSINETQQFCTRCGARVNNSFCSTAEKKKITAKSGKNAMLYIIIILLVILLALVSFMLASMYKTQPEPQKDINNEETYESSPNQQEDTEPDKMHPKDYNEAPAAETIKPSDDNKNSHGQSIELSEDIFEQDDFYFNYNEKYLDTNPEYVTFDDDEFSYFCAVPESFIAYSDSQTFIAPDSTAIMKIYAENNYNQLNIDDTMSIFKNKIRGKVTYSANGDTWFAMSVQKDGINYYIKCFVDHYIRYFTFTYPAEYTDVYDSYINYIEDNYKRTD